MTLARRTGEYTGSKIKAGKAILIRTGARSVGKRLASSDDRKANIKQELCPKPLVICAEAALHANAFCPAPPVPLATKPGIKAQLDLYP